MKLKQLLHGCFSLALWVSLLGSAGAYAQSTGDNLDFSYGDFTNWQGEYGTWSSGSIESMSPGFSNPNNVPTLVAGGAIVSLPADGAPQVMTGGSDPFVPALSKVPPYVSGTNSAKLGDSDHSWAEVNRLTYDLVVTSSNSFFYYDYAVVFLDPSSGHADNEKPLFSVSIKNSSGNLIGSAPCADYEVISGVSTMYNDFDEYPYTFNGITENILWKDWTRVGMDLTDYIGQTITIVFESRDCGQGGHFGYAYISAGTFGSDMTIDACDGAATIELPVGFEEYDWSTGGDTNEETIGFGTIGDVTCDITSENGCTLEFVVEINNDFSDVAEVNDVYCTNTLELSNCFSENTDVSFVWSPDVNISSTTDSVVTVQATPGLYNTSQTYTLQTTIAGEVYESTYIVNFIGDLLTAGEDVVLDCGESAELGPCGAMDGASYSWSPSYGLSADNIANPVVSETIGNYPSQTYYLTISHQGNTYVDSVTVSFTGSVFEAGPSVALECGDSAVIGPCGEIPGATYNWVALGNTPADFNIDDPGLVNPTVYIGATANMETVYELTITLEDGTQVTDQVTVTLVSDPADLGGGIVAECGPVDLGVCTVLKGATYQWSPPDGLSTTTGPGTTVTPVLGMTYPIVYSLQVTEADGTIHNGSVMVDYLPPASELIELTVEPELADGDVNNCARDPQHFIASGGPDDMVYTWEIISESANPEDDVYEFIENDFTGAPANGAEVSVQFYNFDEEYVTLKVTGTSASSPCFTGEGTIKVRYCCYQDSMLKIEGSYAISDLADSTSVYSTISSAGGAININNQSMLIADTLYINTLTYWTNCDVKFKEKAVVIVKPGVSFYIRGCDLEACNKMWDGIYVSDSSNYLLIGASSVKHAHQAVVSSNGAKIHMELVDFVDNNRGVVVRDFVPNNPTDIHPSRIQGCSFSTYEMRFPLEGQKPYAGIEIDNVVRYHPTEVAEADIFSLSTPLTIPDYYLNGTGSGNYGNTFQGLQHGIRMHSTKGARIAGHEFVECEIGILVENSIGDMFYRNAFIGDPEEGDQGMSMTNIDEDEVYLNYFRHCGAAISASNDGADWLTDYDTPHLTSGTTQLNYWNYFIGPGIAHRTNYIRMHVEGNFMKQARNRFTNVKRGSKVLVNEIVGIANGETAIDVQNNVLMPYGNDVDVLKNTIEMETSATGIRIRGLNSFTGSDTLIDPENANHQVTVLENDIAMEDMNNEISYGIRAENSNNIIIGYNSIENSGDLEIPDQYYNLRGIGLDESYGSHVVSNFLYSMSLGLHGIGNLKLSVFECNRFLYNYHGIYFEGSAITPSVSTYVSQQGDIYSQPLPAAHRNVWYDAPYSGSRLGGSTDNPTSVKWYWDIGNPAIYQHNSIAGIDNQLVGNTQDQCTVSPPEEWTADVDYNLLMTMATASRSNPRQAMEDMAQYGDYRYAYRVLRENPGLRDPATADGLILRDFYELLDQSNLREFYEVSELIAGGEFEAAWGRNEELHPDLPIERDLQLVNAVYIRQLIRGDNTLSPEDEEMLRNVAYLTPYEGGEAVYLARAILGVDPQEGRIAHRVSVPEGTTQIGSIQMYPNPSSGRLTLMFDTPDEKNCVFECYDAQGKLIRTQNLPAHTAEHQVDLSQVTAGMYFVRIVQDGQVLFNEKLVLIR